MVMADTKNIWILLGDGRFHRRFSVLLTILGIIVAIIAASGLWYKATKKDQITQSTEISIDDLSIQQNTQGDNSPTISNVRGNVIINQSE